MSEYVRITDRKIEITNEGVEALMSDEELNEHTKGYEAGCQDVYELVLEWYSECDFLTDSQRLVIERLMHHLDTKIYYERKETI